MAEKAKVRLTIFGPDHEHEVDPGEIPGLRAQGLLIEDKPAAKTPATSKAAGSAAAKEN